MIIVLTKVVTITIIKNYVGGMLVAGFRHLQLHG
jgi:hypothetical protein